MEHSRTEKKWYELKTQLGKNCTTDKFNSEGRVKSLWHAGGYEARTSPDINTLQK
jgi:hypothetical protein